MSTFFARRTRSCREVGSYAAVSCLVDSLVWQCPALCCSGRKWFLAAFREAAKVSRVTRQLRESRATRGLKSFASSCDRHLDLGRVRCQGCRPEDRAPKLWFEKQWVVESRDGCVAGDRRTPGRTSTGDEFLYLAASHPLLYSASVDRQGPVLRDGLGSRRSQVPGTLRLTAR